MPPDPLRDRLQATLGDAYAIGREMGGGGMSRVFLAEESRFGRQIVVKVLAPDLAEGLSATRFEREIALAARLQHPNVVPVLTAGDAGGLPWYTMPFVAGDTLRERMAAGPVPLAESARILGDVARALAYAHGHGVVHRDIKPENILLSGGAAVVTDFGIAKAVSAARTRAGDATLTQVGTSVGTPAYMAPEQALGDSSVDYRADIYAWGVVAYELLAGRHPFAGRTSTQQLIAAHVAEVPAPLAGAAPTVSASLAALVTRCLAKPASDRPDSAGELLRELDGLMLPTGGRPAPRLGGRSWRWAAAASTLLAAGWLAFALAGRRHGGPTAADDHLPRSVGVLPFENLGADAGSDYFTEGITEEISDALGRVPGLRIAVERAGPAGQRDGRDPRAIGRAMGVDALLQGSIQRDGGRVRITARLVNAADGFQLWSARYDREQRDVFDLQDDLAKAIVGELKLRLTGGSTRAVRVATANPEAHLLYLQGMYYWNRRGVPMLRKSMELFRQAIAKDPAYAAPHAGLALAYAVIPDYTNLDVRATEDTAIREARAALALDSTSSDAWTAIGDAHAHLWRNREGLDAFARAIALDSTNARARQWYAELLVHVGRYDDALRQVHRARELEPLTLIINSNVGRVEVESRRYREAEATLRHTLELDSSFSVAHELLSVALMGQGRLDESLAEREKAIRLQSGRAPIYHAGIAFTDALAGRRDAALAMLHELEAQAALGPASHGALATLLSALGDEDRAVRELEVAVAQYDPDLKLRSREPKYDILRRDPRTAPLFAQVESVR